MEKREAGSARVSPPISSGRVPHIACVRSSWNPDGVRIDLKVNTSTLCGRSGAADLALHRMEFHEEHRFDDDRANGRYWTVPLWLPQGTTQQLLRERMVPDVQVPPRSMGIQYRDKIVSRFPPETADSRIHPFSDRPVHHPHEVLPKAERRRTHARDSN